MYYSANCVGRLVGTLASGALYSYVGSTIVDGMGTCLLVSTSFALASAAIDAWLHDEREGSGWVAAWTRCLPGRRNLQRAEAGAGMAVAAAAGGAGVGALAGAAAAPGGGDEAKGSAGAQEGKKEEGMELELVAC